MEPIFKKINYVKVLVPKSLTFYNFETLYEEFNKFRNSINKKDKNRDDVMIEVYKTYSALNKLLHDRNGEIKQKKKLMLGEEITNMIKSSKDLSNSYLPYFSMLSTIDDEPITLEILQKRYERIKKTHEFSEDINDEEALKREQCLLVAYFILSKILEENDGEYTEPDRLMEMQATILHSHDKNIIWESKEDSSTYKEINDAKIESVKKFLPAILLKSIDGKTSKETIEKNYKTFLSLNIFGKNIEHNTKIEFETIYQSIKNKISEYITPISDDDKKNIINSYEKNIPNVDLEVAISMMLKDNSILSSNIVLITLKDFINQKNDEDISSIEKLLNAEFNFIVLDKLIKENGGKCTSKEANDMLEKSIKKIEEYKQIHRKENKNPIDMFPKDFEQTLDERYYSLLYDIRNNMKTKPKTIEDVYSQMGLAELCKEYYNVVNKPEKRKELENIKFDVDQSDNYCDIGICNIQCIRNSEKKDVLMLENSIGDKINVTEVGKLGYSAVEKYNGKDPIFSDTLTNLLYLVTKTYHSTENQNEIQKEKQFLVFSKYLIPMDIEEDSVLYSLYADQIFSDISLETAVEKNGRLIGTPIIYKNKETGDNEYNIVFDRNALAACIELDKAIKEFKDISKSDNNGNTSEPKVVKRIKGRTLIGDSNVPLSKGYATAVMVHENARPHEEDVMIAFEWSNKERTKTIFNLIKSLKNKEM